MSCALVCQDCGHHQKSGTFDPHKRCEKCDASPDSLTIESDEDFSQPSGDEGEDE